MEELSNSIEQFSASIEGSGTGGTEASSSIDIGKDSQVDGGVSSASDVGGDSEMKEGVDADIPEDEMTEEQLRAKYLNSKRNAVTSDDVDLIMASRQKKWSIEVPPTPVENGSTVRRAIIEDDDMIHLMMEIKEGEFDNNASRPDLELLTVGAGAKEDKPVVYVRQTYLNLVAAYKEAKAAEKAGTLSKKQAKKLKKPKKAKIDVLLDKTPIGDRSKGLGLEIPYDSARKVFVLSPTLEDKVLLLVRNDLAKACVISSGVTYFGKLEEAYIDPDKQRMWRRLVRTTILPLLQDEKRMVQIVRRLKAAREAKALKEKVWTAEEVEYSDTDDDDDEDAGDEEEEKK
jgi:hypothetical protein